MEFEDQRAKKERYKCFVRCFRWKLNCWKYKNILKPFKSINTCIKIIKKGYILKETTIIIICINNSTVCININHK